MFLRKFKPFNRRKQPRFEPAVTIPVTCVFQEAGSQVECAPHILNISRGGVFMMFTEKKIYPGTAIELRFKLPGDPSVQSVKGVITRTYRRHKEKDYYSGVRFQDTSLRSVQQLFSFLTGIST